MRSFTRLLFVSLAIAVGGAARSQTTVGPLETALVDRAVGPPVSTRDVVREIARAGRAADAAPAPVPRAPREPNIPSPLTGALDRTRRTCSALQTVGAGLALVAACGKTGACATVGRTPPTYCKVDRWL